jgi:hypothetical protein
MPKACCHESKDWVARRRSFVLGWGLPGLALAGSLFMEPPGRAWIWCLGLLWMGVACTANAFRSGRTHCYFTGPFFLLMACLTLLYGLGMVKVGARGWEWLGLGLVLGTVALGWLPEQMWGQFTDRGLKRQEPKRGLPL